LDDILIFESGKAMSMSDGEIGIKFDIIIRSKDKVVKPFMENISFIGPGSVGCRTDLTHFYHPEYKE
jgi:hypothetical protein